MTRVVGIDGCKGGWVAVALEDGEFAGAATAASVAKVLERLEGEALAAIGIDIPIGLPELVPGSRRECDAAARAWLRGRASTIFDALPEAILRCETYAEARALAEGTWGRSVSSQAYNLRVKILEVAEALDEGGRLAFGVRVAEVHPELSFAAMNDHDGAVEPLSLNKRSFGGVRQRQALLDAQGIGLDVSAEVARVQADDVLDAAAVAWSAARIAAGEQVCLGPADGPTISF